METFCLVLTGRLTGADPAAAEAQLAAAFGMPVETFREKVWQRAPLIIRHAMAGDVAETQARQLQAMGAEAVAMADDASRIWLLRADRVLGPLPAAARDRFAATGDRWCHDGDASWQELPAAASPPTLPATAAVPPPLPRTTPVARRRHLAAWIGAAIVLLLLGGFWIHRSSPPPVDPASALRYVPRPLQPMASSDDRARTCTDATGVAAANDEDHFLLAGGRRQLTGRSQRKGDTYVAEAVVQRDAQCQPSAVQLYVFRHGVFIGTPMETPIDPRQVRLSAFALTDDGQLSYTLQRCDARAGSCSPDETYRARLQPGSGGWVLAYGGSGDAAGVEIISRPPPHYPDEAVRQHHEGTVLLVVTIGADGLPLDVAVEQSSGFAELDAAALASARGWRFHALQPDGTATTAKARVPVRFHLASQSL